jgi:hypothetical protein
MRKNVRTLTLLIIVSLLLNAVVPRFALCAEQCDDLASLIQQQPLIKYCYSLTTIPIDIVAGLLAEKVQLGTSAGKPARRDVPSSNTSTDFSITGSMRLEIARGSLNRLPPSVAQPAETGIPVCGLAAAPPLVDSGGGGGPGIALCLLMTIILLPRGSIEDAAARFVRYASVRSPIWLQPKLGFSFGATA